MKKLLLSVVAFATLSASAQILNVASVEKLATPVNVDAQVAGIAPDGSYILLTTGTNQGLQKFDLNTHQVMTITKAEGAGFNVAISEDGKEVVYRETVTGADKLRRSSLVKTNLDTKRAKTLVAPTRDLQGFAVRGNTVLAVNNRQLKTQAIDTKKAVEVAPVLSIQNQQLMLTINGITTTLSPNGTNESYIWPSISPDGTKICYYVAGNGAWVANLDGSNPQYIAHNCRAAKWYNNNVIVGMADEDNGEFVTASNIVAYNLNGQSQVLTDGTMMAMYPFPCANGSKIAFSTENGETYLIHLK